MVKYIMYSTVSEVYKMKVLVACEESQEGKTFPGIAKAMAEQWG